MVAGMHGRFLLIALHFGAPAGGEGGFVICDQKGHVKFFL